MTTAPQSGFDFAAKDRRGGRGYGPPRIELTKLFDRLPPHAPEAEMSLLGSMILDPRVVSEVIQTVPSSDAFYSQSHAAIFDALVQTYDRHQSGDLVQLTESLRASGVLDEVGGAEYLLRLAEGVPSAAAAPHYARIVREKADLRRLIDAAGQTLYEAYGASGAEGEGARDVLDRAEQRIFEIADKASGGLDSDRLHDLLQQLMDVLEAQQNRRSPVTGVSTGFRDLDELTSGLQRGEMIVIAARPSMGKTALMLNLAENIALRGLAYDPPTEEEHGGRRLPHGACPVAIFSMEMSRQSVAQRLLSAHAGVDSHRMRKGMLTQEDFGRLIHSCGMLGESPIYVDDTPSLTVMMLRAKARRMVAQHRVRCVMIDYMQLMSAPGASGSRESRQVEVSAISRGLKALARELNMPVICLAQLNRGAEMREGHRPRMADLRESGSIEQDADVIMLLHREEYYHTGDVEWQQDNPDKVGVAELIIAKQRNGPTGTVELVWDSGTTQFRDKAHGGGFGGGYSPPPPSRSAPASTPASGARNAASSPDRSAGQLRDAGSAPAPRPAYSGFSPGSRSGPVENHRDGGGPDRDEELDEFKNGTPEPDADEGEYRSAQDEGDEIPI